MSNLVNFFIESNICLLTFGGFYYLLFKNETNFRFNRWYLLSSVLLSLTVPLFHFNNIFSGVSSTSIVDNVQTILLPGLTIGAGSTEISEANSAIFSLPDLIAIIYVGVALVLLTVFVYQLFEIFKFYTLKRNYVEKRAKHVFIPTDGQLPTFSFFKLLFFDNSEGLTTDESTKIIEHEQVHIDEYHSLDIIFLEVVKIIFWINPMSWVIRKQLEDIHEYIADQQVIKQTNESDYSSLLAKMALKKMSLSLGHHFNKSLTLKRITMMKKPSNKIKKWKLATMLPIVLIVVVAFSCNDEVMNDIDDVMETASQTAIPERFMDDLKRLQESNPDANFAYMEFSGDTEEAFSRLKLKLDEIDPSTIGLVDIDKEEKRIGVLVNKNGALKSVAKSEIEIDGSEVFQIVDDPATPPGGSYADYYSKIAEVLKYPKSAKEAGIEGKVYIQFIIKADGSLSDVKAVKGIGGGCDEEAVAAIESITGWSPGKQNDVAVNQRLILPISFSLGTDQEGNSGK